MTVTFFENENYSNFVSFSFTAQLSVCAVFCTEEAFIRNCVP